MTRLPASKAGWAPTSSTASLLGSLKKQCRTGGEEETEDHRLIATCGMMCDLSLFREVGPHAQIGSLLTKPQRQGDHVMHDPVNDDDSKVVQYGLYHINRHVALLKRPLIQRRPSAFLRKGGLALQTSPATWQSPSLPTRAWEGLFQKAPND